MDFREVEEGVAWAPRSRPPELPEDDDRELKYAPTRTQYKGV
jgi:hypothetical protein